MYEGITSKSNFKSNHADNDGGAAYNTLVANCLFEYNSAKNGGAMNGIRVTNSKFNHNSATGYGGAVCNANVSTNSQFNDNTANMGDDTYNVTFFDQQDIKTFFDLNATINNNSNSDVYLNDNYTFDLGSDAIFRDGIVINRAVTIHGNGHTIDGDNTARMFIMTGDNEVIFKDIIFVNGKGSGNGGAIYNSYTDRCTVINCTFINNSVSTYSYGGAIFNVNAINSTFINNSAYYGGAMYYGSAENCNFHYNTASDGGACHYVDLINCNFTNNLASYLGGAAKYGSCIDCIFIDNSARYGGAIREVSATNCIFKNNHAEEEGGAMSWGPATNCTFINNSAGYGGAVHSGDILKDCTFINNSAVNGGATYGATAINCNFTSNHATENGGAMYEGSTDNCIFKDNKAGISGDDTYNTIVPKPILIVYNFTSTYNSGDKLLSKFTTASGLPINNANITIRIYKNNALVGTYYALSGEGWAVELDAGSYIAVCSVENQAYEVEPANATLTINKDSSKLTSSAVTTVYNGGKYLVVTLKDSKNRPISNVKVSINLNGVKTLTTDKNGQIKLITNALVPKTYTAIISFDGNTNYIKSTQSVKVTVKKATPKLTAKKKTFKKSVKTKKYTITLKTNQNKAMKKAKVTLKIKGKTYKATTNAKGKAVFKIKKLTKKGKYKATVTYKGNNCYNKVTQKVKITVK